MLTPGMGMGMGMNVVRAPSPPLKPRGYEPEHLALSLGG